MPLHQKRTALVVGLGLVTGFAALIALLGGACATLVLVSDYEPTTLTNDTKNRRALCQDAESLRPSVDWLYPGESMLAHSGISCPVHDTTGSYIGCIGRSAIHRGNGGTIFVSEASTETASDLCGPNSTAQAEAFDPSKHPPKRKAITSADRKGYVFVFTGYLVAVLGLIGAAMAGSRLVGTLGGRTKP